MMNGQHFGKISFCEVIDKPVVANGNFTDGGMPYLRNYMPHVGMNPQSFSTGEKTLHLLGSMKFGISCDKGCN